MHCTLCGCNPARPCRSIGIAREGDIPDGEREAQGIMLPAFACTILANGRCSHCQQCEQCGDPLDSRAQLVLVGRRKHRLCATPQPCPGGDACEAERASGVPAMLPPCAPTATGDMALDAMNEAARFGDRETMARTLDAWLQTLGWEPADFTAFRIQTAPVTV
jgi:hypothetical protein